MKKTNSIENVGADGSVCPRNKGITLISLIITIIVLLILVVVSINLLINEGIIGHATKAVKQYEEAEFEEKIGLIFQSYIMSNYAGEEINNKKVTNDILDIFNYPNIDEETGLAEGTTDGTITEEAYTMNSSNGKVTIKNNFSKESLLETIYDKNNKPDFTIIYNGKIYKYTNFKLASKTDYYIQGNASEWKYTELEDGTIQINEYIGNGEVDKENPELLNLTIPNKLNGKIVTQASFASSSKLATNNKINGKLTVSAGIELIYYPLKSFIAVTTLELKENVKSVYGQGYLFTGDNKLKNIVLSEGVYLNINGGTLPHLENVELSNNVTLGGLIFVGANKLSEESINKIINKANFSGTLFSGFSFENSINLVIEERSKINGPSEKIFKNCNNINSITIKEGANVNNLFTNGVNKLEKIVIENNCSITNGFSNIEVGTIEIGNNNTLGGYTFSGVTVDIINVDDGNKYKEYSMYYVSGIDTLKIGDNSEFISNFYRSPISNCEFEKVIIGDNTIISGKLIQESSNVKKVVIGENAKLTTFSNSGRNFGTFYAAPSVETVILGKGTEIGGYTFINCTNLKEITLYLTEEQKKDNTKIPRVWKSKVSNATFTEAIDNEKIVWTVTYATAE